MNGMDGQCEKNIRCKSDVCGTQRLIVRHRNKWIKSCKYICGTTWIASTGGPMWLVQTAMVGSGAVKGSGSIKPSSHIHDNHECLGSINTDCCRQFPLCSQAHPKIQRYILVSLISGIAKSCSSSPCMRKFLSCLKYSQPIKRTVIHHPILLCTTGTSCRCHNTIISISRIHNNS